MDTLTKLAHRLHLASNILMPPYRHTRIQLSSCLRLHDTQFGTLFFKYPTGVRNMFNIYRQNAVQLQHTADMRAP